ncbi:MAG TPA: Jag N-terminal domain-containing protein, partial [Acidimicrobiia bacterium]|nr:Jag N-terminal domain-containing protein [Acidimicrobiia bacterium]
MEWIESTGTSIEEALHIALDTLGINRDEIEYEIISEPKKGVFGIGGTDARIRARVKPISREKPQDKKRRGSQKKASSKTPSKTSSKKAPKERTAKKEENKMDETETRQENQEEAKREYAEPLDVQAQYAKDFLSGLVKYFDDSCSIDSNFDEDMINVSVDGKQVGLLIGSHGSTLFAVEELMRAVVQAKVGGYTARMYLDVGGYRAKRKEALAEFASNLAAKVKESGRT